MLIVAPSRDYVAWPLYLAANATQESVSDRLVERCAGILRLDCPRRINSANEELLKLEAGCMFLILRHLLMYCCIGVIAY